MRIRTSFLMRLNAAPLHAYAVSLAFFFTALNLSLGKVFAGNGITSLGIDLGSQFIKVSYIAPGADNPLRVMINKMSERKYLNSISFTQSKPVFGSHALKRSLNRPERGYAWLNLILGRKFDDESVQNILKYSTAAFEKDQDTGLVNIKTGEDQVMPVNYLVALLLKTIVEESELSASKSIKDAVITVPPYFSQAQRQAVLDAAKIAGLPVSSLIHDISAAALYYGVFYGSKLTSPRHIVVFDSGSSHSSAALVFVNPKYEENSKSSVLVEVKRTVSDTNLCGLALDRIVVEMLAKKFAQANGGMQVAIGKSYNRLLVEAGRVKHVLSANPETRARVEDIVDEMNLNAAISRDEFSEESSHLHHAASSLIKKLLEEEGLALKDVEVIIPMGGNNRVPFIRDDLSSAFGDKVQSILNMDESIAQGAAWYAAMLANYKIKPTRFIDSFPYSVTFEYVTDAKADKSNNITVYGPHSHVLGHKGVSLKNLSSISGKIIVHDDSSSVTTIAIDGMQQVLDKYREKELKSSKIKFWVDLSSSGLVEIKETPVALIEFESKEPKLANPTDATNTTEPMTLEPETILVSESHPITLKVQSLYPKLSDKESLLCIKSLKALRDAEKEAARRAAAQNSLESNFYRLRDVVKLEDFRKFAGSSDISRLEEQLKMVQTTLDADDKAQTIEEYEKILHDTLSIEQTVRLREAEHLRRVTASAELMSRAKEIQDYVDLTRRSYPDEAARGPSNADLESLQNEASSAISWLKMIDAEQSQRDPSLDLIIPSIQLKERINSLIKLFQSISSKKKEEPKDVAPTTEAPRTQPTDQPTPSPEPAKEAIEEEKMEL